MQMFFAFTLVLGLSCMASAQPKMPKKTIPKEDIMVMIDRRVDSYMMSTSTDGKHEMDKIVSDLTEMLEKGTDSTEEFLDLMGVLETNYINRISKESKKVIDPNLKKRDPDGYFRAVMRPLHNRMTLTMLQVIMVSRAIPQMEDVLNKEPMDGAMRVIDLGRRKGGRGRSCGERYPLR